MYNKRILFVAAHCNVFDGCFFVISRVPADKYAYCPVCSRCCKPITQKLIYYTPVNILALGQKKIKSFRYQVVEIQNGIYNFLSSSFEPGKLLSGTRSEFVFGVNCISHRDFSVSFQK